MAIMHPEKPTDFDPNSREDIMFEALKGLSDEYYVFHSFSIVSVVDTIVHESETDFVVFHPKKGILCIEAKAGQVKCEYGVWKYGSGREMSHGGPFNQAAQNKWKLKRYIEQVGLGSILNRCKLMHAVWFPSVNKQHIDRIAFPPEADKQLTLTMDAMNDIESSISKLFNIALPGEVETSLSGNDVQNLINRVLAPSFNLISLSDMKISHNRQVYKVMLREQVALLNYLEEQNNAVINGMAGTGKTVLAIEKAKRHAQLGEEVLFLCYNAFLKDYLTENYSHEHIRFYTIDGLACKLCNTPEPNYSLLKEKLEETYFEGTFPYQHIIIDEGQDFGQTKMEETEIIELLKSNVLDDESKNGTFYLFYDRNQMIQAEKAPDYIGEADCKLTLYRNCRNTENIALTSLRLLGSKKKPKLLNGALPGDSPELYITDTLDEIQQVINKTIRENIGVGIDNIVILTCRTEATSIIADSCKDGEYLGYKKPVRFTTCRKYKGLEADVIILVDMNRELFESGGEQLYYVGASRARYRLVMIANMSEAECDELIRSLDIRKTKKQGKALAAAFNAKYREIE